MSMLIVKKGLLDTIQDAGRYGYQHFGINPGGVMDLIAMRVANILVGNDPDEPLLEMHFPAAEILFEETCLIALAGADCSAEVNGKPVSNLCPIILPAGSGLKFVKQEIGARIYLAVWGGIQTDEWLGSSSTHLKINAGGYNGRALQKGDRISLKKKLSFKNDLSDCVQLSWKANISSLYRTDQFRFIKGAEWKLLDDNSKHKLNQQKFTIATNSDRMGYRLEAEPLKKNSGKELLSTAVTRGTVQLLPDGQLIILMADHQTTGGYPRVANIISADFPSLAQMRPSESFCLKEITMHEAEAALSEQQMHLRQLQNACIFRLQSFLQNT